MRYAAKRDNVEEPIVEALVSRGVSVRPINDKGWPDLLTWRGWDIKLIEAKSPTGKFTPRQKMWKLIGLPVYTATTVEQALDVWGLR